MQLRTKSADRLLIALALAGAAAYFLLYPRLFPDGALRLDVPEAEVRNHAFDFAYRAGFMVDEGGPTRLQRQIFLHDSLQTRLGRKEVVRSLRRDAPEVPPLHIWTSTFGVTGRNGTEPAQGTVTVRMTPQGRVWNLSASSEVRSPRAHRGQLRAALGDLEALPGDLETLPDSVLLRRLQFDREAEDTTGLAAAAAAGAVISIPVYFADRMARSILADTYWATVPLELDSVVVATGAARNVATARYRSAENALEQDMEVSVRLTAAGGLQEIGTRIRGGRDEPVMGSGARVSGIEGGVMIFTYLILSVILVVSFFRRMTAHAIDYRAAVRDGALAAGLLVLYFSVTVFADVVPGLDEGIGVVLGLSLTLLVMSALAGVYVFVLSATADSASREVWPERLRALTLSRQAYFLNSTVGRSILRGVGGTFVLLGATALFAWVFGGARLVVEQQVVTGLNTVTHLVSNFSVFVFVSLVACHVVLLGIGSLLYKRTDSTALFVLAGVLFFAAASVSITTFAPEGYTWLLSGLAGMLLVWLFLQYDFLVPFLALALAPLIWSVSMGWAVAGSPLAGAAIGTLLLLIVLCAVGFIGVRTGQDESELPTYVPQYVKEQARHQHVERELDIARKVQTTFLPRRMPQLKTASVSAICIPAYEVGGDYYDFMTLDGNRIAVVIGDVSGKGIQAAFYMTLIKGFVQTLCCETHTPYETLRRINYLFCRNAPRGTFVSLIFGIFDQREGTFRFARAGHSPVIHKKAGASAPELISPSGMAVGLTDDERFASSIKEETIHLDAGDSLILYTDGISEAVDRRNMQFGEERLLKAVSSSSGRRAEQLIDAVSLAVQNFARGVRQHDDMTMVVLKVNDDYIRPAVPPHKDETALYARCEPDGDGCSTPAGNSSGG